MNTPGPDEIEHVLRHAPRPQPPAGLKARLLPRGSGEAPPLSVNVSLFDSTAPPWWSRWWPALALGCLSLICLGVLARQQQEIRQIQRAIQELRSPEAAKATVADAVPREPVARPVEPALGGHAEMARLAADIKRLTAETADLERLRQANAGLRRSGESDTAAAGLGSGPVDNAETQAQRCINKLKQLGLAARIWATDNSDVFPPNIVAMTNEIGSPVNLTCPADPEHKPAVNWASLTAANISYEYLAASVSELEPERVMWRCPIHGYVTLCDGSVQRVSPSQLQSRSGTLYFLDPRRSTGLVLATNAPPTGAVRQMDVRLMMRYGLLPPGVTVVPPEDKPAPEEQPAQEESTPTDPPSP